MKIKIKLLGENSKIPKKAHKADAGFDLTAASKDVNTYSNIISYGTGISINIPEGFVGLIYPRSSIYKKDLSLVNSVGVIDAGYRGEIGVVLKNLGEEEMAIEKNMRIAQMLIQPVVSAAITEADSLDDTARGEGGFGSTGTK